MKKPSKILSKTLRQKLKDDFIHYAQRCLKIRSKNGAIEPFVLNGAQCYLHDCLEQQRQRIGRVRAIILKGRQQGCSTYVEGRFYWKVTHQKGAQAFILTHLDEASKTIYQIAKRFHDHCPAPVKPHTGLSNSRELVFDRLDSGYRIGTAKSPGIGRSNTLQFFHGSEVAYWSNADEHMAGILQAVPDAPGTEIILESTASGPDGLFRDLCAEALAGRSDYQFIFIPWFWQREYRKPVTPSFILTADESDIGQNHTLDLEQLCWRRQKIAELGSLSAFRREYPATPDEAFMADMQGALWLRETIENNRVHKDNVPDLRRVVVAIDPAVSKNQASDETGIIVAGLGFDGHAYILDDISGKYTPAGWAAAAVAAFDKFKADRIVAEVNQGGDMVEHTLRTLMPRVPFKSVRASRGKMTRAEPIAALDTQGKIHHAGVFTRLEDQMCRFDGTRDGESPDRVDARVWALTELMLDTVPSPQPKVWMG